MKKGRFASTLAVCPFYRWETANSVTCRGYDEQTNITTTFGLRQDARDVKSGYCQSERGYRECPLYRLLESEAEDRFN